MAERQKISDSIRSVQQEQLIQQQVMAEAARQQQAAKDTLAEKTGNVDAEKFGVFASLLEGENEFYTLENSKVRVTISKKGGKPWGVELKEYKTSSGGPLMLFQGDSTVFGLNFFSSGKSIDTDKLYFEPLQEGNSFLADSDSINFRLRLNVDSLGAFVEYSYTLHPESYLVDFSVRLKGMEAYRTDNVQLNWDIFSPQQEKGRQNEATYTYLTYRFFEGDVEKFKPGTKKTDIQEITETTKLHWIAYKQQFFAAVILSDKIAFEGGYMASEKLPDTSPYLLKYKSELGIPYDRTSDFVMPMHFYFGPNHYQTLKRIGFEMEELVTIGNSIIRWINVFVVIPIFNWLNRFIGNYGLIILLLTIIIKIGLLPLTYRSYMSQAKMRVLKPEIDEINAKIPKEKAMERQQATMALYRKVGVNPMGGCIPLLLQMPILFAMFRFFPASIELRQESFLWAKDLSTYDSILDLPFTIPMYGDHISLFTLLMTVSTILSMRMNTGTTGAEAQMPGMKTMMYIMPVMFMLILNNFSAGLTYYYFLANVITIGQNYLFKQFVDEVAVRKKLHARKAKPEKKSGFQQRLEEMAKQRGYKMPKK
jgi:YidC/Oxa1 family membrane protein insertase